MIFSLNTLELSGDLNTPNGIDEALNVTEKKPWKKSDISEVNNFLNCKSWLIRSKTKVLQVVINPIGVKWAFKIKE